MADKALVLDKDTGRTKQNPATKDLDIPVTDRTDALEQQMKSLVTYLVQQGFELPDELTNIL